MTTHTQATQDAIAKLNAMSPNVRRAVRDSIFRPMRTLNLRVHVADAVLSVDSSQACPVYARVADLMDEVGFKGTLAILQKEIKE